MVSPGSSSQCNFQPRAANNFIGKHSRLQEKKKEFLDIFSNGSMQKGFTRSLRDMVDEVKWKEEPSSVTRKRQLASSDPDGPFKSRKIGSLSVKSFDPELLDCPICYEPFSIPIFQCENGHTICSPCCQNLAERCPSCAKPIGSIRCRAIEKVLESVKLFCPNRIHGCFEDTLTYGKSIIEHEKTCAQAPCSCPVPGCKRVTGPNNLRYHCASEHADHVTKFLYDHSFTISFTINDKFHVLQEKKGVLFILRNISEMIGNLITIIHIGPSSLKECHSYDLAANIEGTIHTFRSLTTNMQSNYYSHGLPSAGLFLSPGGSNGDNRKISLDICISRLVSCPEDPK